MKMISYDEAQCVKSQIFYSSLLYPGKRCGPPSGDDDNTPVKNVIQPDLSPALVEKTVQVGLKSFIMSPVIYNILT